MLFPVSNESFKENLRMGSEIYHTLKKLIKNEFGNDSTSVGDEGGFAPMLENERVALDLISKAI